MDDAVNLAWSEPEPFFGSKLDRDTLQSGSLRSYETFAYPGCGLDFKSFASLLQASLYVFSDPAPVTNNSFIEDNINTWCRQIASDFDLAADTATVYRASRVDRSVRIAEKRDYEGFRVEHHDIASDYTFLIHLTLRTSGLTSNIVFMAERWENYSTMIGTTIPSCPNAFNLPASFDAIYEHKSNISSLILKRYAHVGSHLIWGLPPKAPELQIAGTGA